MRVVSLPWRGDRSVLPSGRGVPLCLSTAMYGLAALREPASRQAYLLRAPAVAAASTATPAMATAVPAVVVAVAPVMAAGTTVSAGAIPSCFSAGGSTTGPLV